jgi:acetyl esterase/lipase
MADTWRLTVVSIRYRLAPEDPWPAGVQDCFDAADYLIAHPEESGPLLFAGGESAGAHLSCCVALHLRATQPSFAFKGLLLHFGCFDLAGFMP